MRLEQNINTIEDVGFEDSVKMGITSNAAKIQFLLAENTYSDNIGSLIREAVSNGVDATIEINRTDPVLVELVEDSQYNYWFKVSDLGIGISPDRMYNVIANYGTSTKEQSNTQIGAMGLGAKAPFSYTDIFFIDTWFNNVHYKYCFSKGLDGHEITKVIEEDEVRQSGTTVSIQLKSRYDVNSFISKIKEQLCYFKQVVFNVSTIENEYRIIEKDNWICSGLNQDNKLHISLGGVYYPLDFDKLGVKDMYIPIALKFELGCGLQPIPNRERLIFNTKSITLIREKIQLVAQEFADLFNANINDVEDYEALFEYYRNKKCLVLVDGLTLDVRDFENYVTFNTPNYKGTKVLTGLQLVNLKSDFDKTYFTAYYIQDKFNKFPKNRYWKINSNILDKSKTRLVLDVPLTTLLKDYLVDHYNNSVIYYPANRGIGFNEETGHRYLNSYSEIFNWDGVDEDALQDKIHDFELVAKKLFEHVIPISTLVPTKEWLEERTALRTNKKQFNLQKQEINPAFLNHSKRASGLYNCTTYKNKNFIQNYTGKAYPKLVVYGKDTDYELLEKCWCITPNCKYKYCVLADRDVKRIKQAEVKNWIFIDDFIKSKYCQTIVTNYVLLSTIKSLGFFDYKKYDIQRLSRKTNAKINFLTDYKYKADNYNYNTVNNIDTSCLCPCDPVISSCIEELKQVLMPWKDFDYNTKYVDQNLKIDVLKYRKVHLDLMYYKQNNIQTDNESEIENEDGE